MGAHLVRAIAVDGDTMVVGAIDDDQGAEAGAVYVFDRDEGGVDAWGLVAKLTASDGASVSTPSALRFRSSGETVVVGALATVSGHEFGFGLHLSVGIRAASDAWGQVARLTASDGARLRLLRHFGVDQRRHNRRRGFGWRRPRDWIRVRPTSSVGIRGALTPGVRLRN
jgi:hypothetical protein